MKLLALGDLHGRKIWKTICKEADFDKAIFVGDYFDSHEGIPATQQIEVFCEVLDWKRSQGERVVLLLGNHDYHYLRCTQDRYSGFQPDHHKQIQRLLEDALNESLLQICHVVGQLLFVHAGITKTWCKQALGRTTFDSGGELEQALWQLFLRQPHQFGFLPGPLMDPYGEELCQTPLWVRPKSLLSDALEGFVQVVGHTLQSAIRFADAAIFIDALGTARQYLEIVDGKAQAVQATA